MDCLLDAKSGKKKLKTKNLRKESRADTDRKTVNKVVDAKGWRSLKKQARKTRIAHGALIWPGSFARHSSGTLFDDSVWKLACFSDPFAHIARSHNLVETQTECACSPDLLDRCSHIKTPAASAWFSIRYDSRFELKTHSDSARFFNLCCDRLQLKTHSDSACSFNLRRVVSTAFCSLL